MANIYRTKLDIKSPPSRFTPTFVQHDHAILEIELLDEGKPYDLSNAVRVEFTHVRKDGLVIIEPGVLLPNGNTFLISYEYKGSEMDMLGKLKASIAVFDRDDKKTSTHVFEITVTEDLRNEIFNPAEPNAGVFQELLKEVQYVKDNPGPRGPEGPQGPPVELENSLTSDSTTKAVTAARAKELNDKLTTVVAQLAEKAHRNEVRDKSAITLLDLAQDVKEALTGGSVAVVSAGAIDRLNVLNGAISPKKTSFLLENLINLCPINSTNYTWTTNEPTNITFDGEGFMVTTVGQSGLFFAANVEIGKKYSVGVMGSGLSNVRLYQNDKTTFVNCPINAEGYYTGEITAAENVIHLRIWINANTTGICSYAGVFLGAEYKPSYSLNRNITLTMDNIKNRSITTEKCDFFLPSKNLFDKTKCTDGYMVNFSNLSVNAAHTASDYIEIEGDADYVINARVNFSFYGVGKTYISSVNGNAVSVVIHTPNNAKYIRFSLADWGTLPNVKNTAQFEKGIVSTSYQSYELKNLDENKISMTTGNNDRTPLKWVSYGDSITAANTWQPIVSSHYSLIHTNKGIGGTTVSNRTGNADDTNNTSDYFCNINRINGIPNDTQLITIMGGTNDTGQSVPLGDLSYPFDATTFKGALALTIVRIQDRIPNAKLVMLTTLSGRGTTAGQNMTEPVKNTLNLTTEDYAKAIKEVANAFSIPVIDVFGETGINQFNRSLYISDTVHPNVTGGEKIANVVIGGLKRILI